MGSAFAVYLHSEKDSFVQLDAVSNAPARHSDVSTDFDYVKMNSQFIIPIVAAGKVRSLVALSISLEVKKGSGDLIFTREPKIRDVFLRTLFDHANSGGFDGEFTLSGNLSSLRRALVDAGKIVASEAIVDVLITDIARQDS